MTNLPDRFSTDRLQLRIINPEDSDFMYRLVNSEGWLQFIGDRNIHSPSDAVAYIERISNTQDFFYWVARITEGNVPIGIVSFLKRNYLDNFDIGFAFLPEHNGNGYAYEAANEVLSVVLQKPEYNPVLATTIPANGKSIKLLTKLGFRFEKEMNVDGAELHLYMR
jgi:RimJ/RimL family protein N-acetyltransferase